MTNDTRAHKLKISENNILMMQHEIAEFVGFQTMIRFAVVDLWSRLSLFI